ncbi:MAG TPA: rod shape-determining protein RodA [Candidatus Bipolaricaulota bacterium]|nr:rod shape-determining protein RodA [Candidatus Bipolaricaulota bacterium]
MYGIIQKLKKFDWILFTAIFLLLVLGLSAIYSVSLNQEGEGAAAFNRQLIFVGIGLAVFFFFSFFNYIFFRSYSRVIYILTLILLFLVLIFGENIRGTTGWFAIGNFGFQPVELAKIALIFFLAKFFSNRYQHFNQLKHVIVSLAGVLIFVMLILLQPDLGSAMVLVAIWFVLLLTTGVKKRYIAVLLLAVCVISMSSWLFVLKDYQKDRIFTFMHPENDPLGSGYNVAQSMIAVGSGQFLGRGLGFGSQSQLRFIPESQTDFIFAVIAEELGFFGVFLVLGLWGVIFYRLVIAAKKAPNDFAMFALLGITVLFFFHIFVNIGMNMGMVPVTGISLPLLSSGGSFLLISLAILGVGESIIVRSDK